MATREEDAREEVPDDEMKLSPVGWLPGVAAGCIFWTLTPRALGPDFSTTGLAEASPTRSSRYDFFSVLGEPQRRSHLCICTAAKEEIEAY